MSFITDNSGTIALVGYNAGPIYVESHTEKIIRMLAHEAANKHLNEAKVAREAELLYTNPELFAAMRAAQRVSDDTSRPIKKVFSTLGVPASEREAHFAKELSTYVGSSGVASDKRRQEWRERSATCRS